MMSGALSHLLIFLKRISIAFLMYSLMRVLFYFFNQSYFPDITFGAFFYGLRFDIVAISYFFLPFLFLSFLPFGFRTNKSYQLVLKYLFHIGNGLSLLLNGIDLIYYSFTFKRTTADVIGFISTGDEIGSLIPQFMKDFWYVFLLFILLIFVSEWLYRKIKTDLSYSSYQLRDYLYQSVLFLSMIGLLVIGVRGGIQHKPLTIVNAGQYVPPQHVPVVLNTPFTFLKTILEENIKPTSYYSENEIAKIYTPVTKIKSPYKFRKKNVVVIIMESFSTEYIGKLSHTKGYTPFLDSLMDYSTTYTNAFANGYKSIEALPAIFAGIPSLMNTPYIISNYSGNELYSMPKIFKSVGYNTSFYHGGANGTMGFDGFVGVVGIDDYYGLNQYPSKEEDYDGNWGIFDLPYFQYYADELSNKKEPFFSTIFSLSSHHPYTIPEQYAKHFPKGTLPIHETIGYADYALNQFFNRVKKEAWYNNTLFVITADHTAQAENAYYKSHLGQFAVPIILFDPAKPIGKEIDQLTQHCDINTLVLKHIGFNGQLVLFSDYDKETPFVVQYLNNTYQIADGKHLLLFDGEQSTAFYNLVDDSLQTKNLLKTVVPDSLQKVQHSMEQKIKGIIQQHNNRLINNEFVIR